MSNSDKNTIVVSAQALNVVLSGFRNEDKNLVKIARALDELEDSLNNHRRIHDGVKEIKVGDIVTPKTGWNTLRAGSTAYGQAVVVDLNPFLIVSIDGLCEWPKTDPSNFIIAGQANEITMLLLNAKRKKK